MLDERPAAAELIAAVAEFLEREVRPALEGRAAFHTTVAVGVLRIVERELGADLAAEHARLRALTGADGDLRELNALLAQRIRDGDLSIEDEVLRDHLVRSVLTRLAVDNPGYPSLAEAARYWPLP
ncbi:MAG TPA: DUF6285 domain-containing protein [Actinophytocola sp.]|jgi:hypothetical protein|uniref:DUF6285 domain-containing protein n=1 Tax=Actinophytocola sp. TaxID=1872138 RepID=UPI002DFD491F|nr:DUF6285 domain-containing protein [Actinophytocola sp.]